MTGLACASFVLANSILSSPVLSAPVPGAQDPSLLNPQGPISGAEMTILWDSMAIMLVIIVPTIVATLGFVWWYRASNTKARYLPDWAYSGRVELVVWAIPILVICLLGGVAWVSSHELDPAKPLASKTPAVQVQVVSLDWKWLFIYPGQGVASVNQLVIPAGTPVHLSLTSGSVLNAFSVPQLGGMLYTMNGMSTQLNLQADRPGIYYGQSAHFSGDGFSDMNFQVQAVPAGQFAAWAAQARGAPMALDKAAYQQLAVQSRVAQPITYRLAEPNLYQELVDQTIPPAAGPSASQSKPQTEH